MPKGYTNRQKVENYLLITIDPSFYTQVDNWISDIEAFIDDYTGRNFKADDLASARKFNGNGEQELVIDDCMEISKVELGNDMYGDSKVEIPAGGTNGYYLLPNNYKSLGIPIKTIHYRGGYWIEGMQNHQITAKWGYSKDCPGDVSMVATLLVAHIYKFGRGGITDGASQERIGNYTVVYKDTQDKEEFERALQVLDKYKRYYL